MKKCILVGGGAFAAAKFKADAPVIAVDGGYEHVRAIAAPIAVVGDFDSLGYRPQGVEILAADPHKDQTDLWLAASYAAQKGFDTLEIFGALGGRLDHTFANLQSGAAWKEKGLDVVLRGDGEDVFFVDRRLEISAEYRYVSVFSMTPTAIVTLRGMEYPLTRYRMTDRFPIGVSNTVSAARGTVEVHAGTTAVVCIDA